MTPNEQLCEPRTGSPLTCPTPTGGAGQSSASDSTPVPTVPVPSQDGDGSLLDVVASVLPWVLAGVLLVVGVVLLILLLRARRALRRRPAAPATQTESTPPADPTPRSDPIPPAEAKPDTAQPRGPERDDLIDELITLADLATAPAVAAQTERVLRRLGVEAIDARPGDAFDPELHAAATTSATDDPAKQQRVASQVRRGWRHGAAVIRPAGVAVWLHAPTDPRRT